MCDLFAIELRTGCMCNQGACAAHLGLSDRELARHVEVCRRLFFFALSYNLNLRCFLAQQNLRRRSRPHRRSPGRQRSSFVWSFERRRGCVERCSRRLLEAAIVFSTAAGRCTNRANAQLLLCDAPHRATSRLVVVVVAIIDVKSNARRSSASALRLSAQVGGADCAAPLAAVSKRLCVGSTLDGRERRRRAAHTKTLPGALRSTAACRRERECGGCKLTQQGGFKDHVDCSRACRSFRLRDRLARGAAAC